MELGLHTAARLDAGKPAALPANGGNCQRMLFAISGFGKQWIAASKERKKRMDASE